MGQSARFRNERPRVRVTQEPPNLRNRDEHVAYFRQWYKENRATEIEKSKIRARLRRKATRDLVLKIKQNSKCLACSENDPVCLDFHHREPSKKDVNIFALYKKGWSIARVMEEIAKCDILCANCHRKLHYGRCGRNGLPAVPKTVAPEGDESSILSPSANFLFDRMYVDNAEEMKSLAPFDARTSLGRLTSLISSSIVDSSSICATSSPQYAR
jgi:hypothetical protein